MNELFIVKAALFAFALTGPLLAGVKTAYVNKSPYKWTLKIAPDPSPFRTRSELGRINISYKAPDGKDKTAILGAGATNANSFDLLPGQAYQVEYTHDFKMFYHVFSLSCDDPKNLIKGIYYETKWLFTSALDKLFDKNAAPVVLAYAGKVQEQGGLLDGRGVGAFCVDDFPGNGGFTLQDPSAENIVSIQDMKIINNTIYEWTISNPLGEPGPGGILLVNDNATTSFVGKTNTLKSGCILHLRLTMDTNTGKPTISRNLKIFCKDNKFILGDAIYYGLDITNLFNSIPNYQKIQCTINPDKSSTREKTPWLKAITPDFDTYSIEDPNISQK